MLYSRVMLNTRVFALLPAGMLAVTSLAAPAHAGIDACGDIDIEASAQCELVVEGGCDVVCRPVNFTASCSAELYVACEGQCSASASVDCHASCEAGCEGSCDVDPGSFDCAASCSAGCSGDCTATCAASENSARCEASCQATCSAGCDAECSVTPPSASCQAKCEASCSGECHAEANLECQVDCQAGGFIDCEARLEGGCMAECESPKGALFCDGQYIDHGGNLQDCIDALEALLAIEVQVSGDASGTADCVDGACEAEGQAEGSISCSAGPASSRRPWGFGVLGALGALALFRRRR